MLQGMRKAGQGWVGKIVVTILFGFLIASFAVWGIGDIFRGYGRNTVAKVGATEITAAAVRNAYQNELQQLTRRYRQPITPERARALGLDAQVFGRLVTEAALDQRARALGLGISNEAVAKSIMEEPAFRGAAGEFDRARFNDLLRANGLSEAGFVREQGATLVRQQIAEALSGAIEPPSAMREAIARFGAERRNAAYFVLPAASAGEIGTPDETVLKSFFDERKTSFRAPEYRKIVVLSATPDSLARPAEVPEAAARARYDEVKASHFGTPERRKLQQVAFPTEAEADAASARIKAGASLVDIGRERGLADKDLELGSVSRIEIFDPAVREAAFALPASGVSGPIAGQFGPVIVAVEAIEPERVKPFEAVADEVRRDIAVERARGQVNDMHDKIEDQRAAARPLGEIAQGLGLEARAIAAVDRSGQDKDTKPVALPDKDALLAAAFASDVGADNEAIRTKDGGYLWFEVAGIDPARDRTLDEVRGEAVKRWRSDEIARRLTEKARASVARLDQGEAMTAVAAAAGQSVKTAEGLARSASNEDLGPAGIAQVFATRLGKAGSAALGEGEVRVVFQVTGASVPPFDPNAGEAKKIDEQIKLALSDDLMAEYVAKLRQDLGVSVNQQALRNALGGGDY